MAHMDRMLIWDLYFYRECAWSEIESARAKMFTNMLPATPGADVDAMRQWGEKVASTLVRGQGADV